MTLAPLPKYPRSAYIDPPPVLTALRRMRVEEHGWGRGWPDECPGKLKLATPSVIRPRDGKDFGRPVRKELAPLFGRLFTYAMLLDPSWEMRGRDEPSGGQGGVACRAIKRSNPPAPSNHSQGRAWDCNTKGNPMRKPGEPFLSRQSPVLVELAAAGLCYWGGWYFDAQRGAYVDAMHFEFVGRVQDVPRALTALDAEYERLRRVLYPEPEEPDVEQVKAVQAAINAIYDALGAQEDRLVVDGDYGRLTTAAVDGLPELVRKTGAASVENAQEAIRQNEAIVQRLGGGQ